MRLIFDRSVPGRRGVMPALPGLPLNGLVPGEAQEETSAREAATGTPLTLRDEVPGSVDFPDNLLRDAAAELPELSELDVVRHFTELSRKNFGIDSGFYPLGSCTMKYNPKFTEDVAAHTGFADLHPLLPQLPGGEVLVQGALEVLVESARFLSEICGMAAFTMQPLAGAHGELTGAMIMAAYHKSRGNRKKRILIPDSAHGTNPASAAIAGYSVETIQSDEHGVMDVEALKNSLDDEVAGVMLTCPNTLGLFNPRIAEICRLVHEVDGLMYCDGANLNALLGVCRPGDIGFDIIHVNLHKTFATPHGGGGPGAGPVGVSEKLVGYLPVSVVRPLPDGSYGLHYDEAESIGYIAPFYGNFGVIVKAYAYMLRLGRDGLRRVAENAVLNANYVMARLRGHYDFPNAGTCMHECVLSASWPGTPVKALDVAKALMDRGFHPPTMYFPLTVPEALMIEPTECESRETLDAFIDAMIEIAELAGRDPEAVMRCPQSTPVGRLDEKRAATNPDVASL